MKTYTQIIYHIDFSTKGRARCLLMPQRESLYRYIWGVLKNKDCHLYRIGGVEDHIHILTSIHSSIAVSNLVKDLKLGCTDYIKRERLFPNFVGWQDGYGAFTLAFSDKDRVVEYVKGQEEHHQKVSSRDEFLSMLRDYGVSFEDAHID